MSSPPLADTCVSLALLTQEQVRTVLTRPPVPASSSAFAQRAVELGLLDDEGVARAQAQLHRLNIVPSDRLDRLNISPEILGLLPATMVRQHLLLPTFLDAERQVLSLLTADPDAVDVLQQAQRAARANRLRLFVVARGALERLIQRLLPPTEEELLPPMLAGPRGQPWMVVYEPVEEQASLLSRLVKLETTAVEVVRTPEQVHERLQSSRVVRVSYRRAVALDLEGRFAEWRRLVPQLVLAPVDGWGPGPQQSGDAEAARGFLLSLLEHILIVAERDLPEIRERLRQTVRLARLVSEELDLPPDHRDLAVLGALLSELDDLSFLQEGRSDKRFAHARDLLRSYASPFPLMEALDTLERRLGGQEAPGPNTAVEILFTARSVVRAGFHFGDDPVAALGAEAARHDGAVLRALTAVSRRQDLQRRVATAVGMSAVIVSTRDNALASALDVRLRDMGVEPVFVTEGDRVLALVQPEQTAAILCDVHLPRVDGLGVLTEIRRRKLPIPVFLFAETDRDVARGISMGAEDVLRKPVHIEVLLAKLQRTFEQHPAANAPAFSGRLSELSLLDLLRTLTLGGKTAIIRINGGPELGEVHIRDGKLVAAYLGPWDGEDALYALVDVSEGRFEVRFESSPDINLRGSTQYLLLEAMRRREERRVQ